jgi:hypothetical protein
VQLPLLLLFFFVFCCISPVLTGLYSFSCQASARKVPITPAAKSCFHQPAFPDGIRKIDWSKCPKMHMVF